MGMDATEDIRILVLLWKFGCNSKPGTITAQEWKQGCSSTKVDGWESLKKQVPALDPGFLDNSEFKDFYKFCFTFNLSGTHRTLDRDLVIALLPLVVNDRVPAERLKTFSDFLENHADKKQYARITLDQWTSFFDFCQEVPDLTQYDESTSAWPVLLDEYVDHVTAQFKKDGNKNGK